MTVYLSKGYGSSLTKYDGNHSDFDFIKSFPAMIVPDGASVDEFKRKNAPYCIAGIIQENEDGIFKRNNESLDYRSLIFIDYDNITTSAEIFKNTIHSALSAYSYILYPTIKHTPEKPRYRLVVKPDKLLNELSYKATISDLNERIGLEYDQASLTWSQLQGLCITRYKNGNYEKIVNLGVDYPIKEIQGKPPAPSYQSRAFQSHSKSMTMRIIDTLLNGFGTEGNRNVTLTKFVGLLINKWVDCDIPTAYNLVLIANDQTEQPMPIEELDKTFKSIVKMESRKRGTMP